MLSTKHILLVLVLVEDTVTVFDEPFVRCRQKLITSRVYDACQVVYISDEYFLTFCTDRQTHRDCETDAAKSTCFGQHD